MPGKPKNMMKPYSTDKTEKLLKRLNTSAPVIKGISKIDESTPMIGPAAGISAIFRKGKK
tara:strand:+ start:219 stop:398 length:180 start_codon:yes stop_codon:yes gene_type:complete